MEEVLDREGDIEHVQELCRELKTQRVAYPERRVADVLQGWARAAAARDRRRAPLDKKTQVHPTGASP